LKPLHVLHYDIAVWRKGAAKKAKAGAKNDDDNSEDAEGGGKWIAVSRLPRLFL